MVAAATERWPGINRWRIAGWLLAALVLLIPAVAMQFTREVSWGPGDFIVAAGLLALAGLALEFGIRATASRVRRALIVAGVIGVLLVIWTELAVGLF